MANENRGEDQAENKNQPLAENLAQDPLQTPKQNSADLDLLMDVSMSLSIEIGRTEMRLRDVMNLSKGAIIELNKLSGEPLDVMANGKLIAHGDVVSINGKYGLRLTSLAKTMRDIQPNTEAK